MLRPGKPLGFLSSGAVVTVAGSVMVETAAVASTSSGVCSVLVESDFNWRREGDELVWAVQKLVVVQSLRVASSSV